MTRVSVTFFVAALAILGCDSSSDPLPPPDLGPEGDINSYSSMAANHKFEDDVKSNRDDDGALGEVEFVDTDGNTVKLDQFKGDKNILLVFTRGFSGQLCPYCTTQTSRLIASYDKFVALDTEILLVYPGQKEQLGDFKKASMTESEEDEFPFPVLLDEDLTAVNRLEIAAQLAQPSTFIIDKEGSVRLAYVGSNPADRPSVKALLAQLEALN